MVLDILDVFDKAMAGEKEYDLRIFNKSTEIAKEYGFKCDPNTPVSGDDALADEAFEAAMRLAVKVGGWYLNTQTRLYTLTLLHTKFYPQTQTMF